MRYLVQYAIPGTLPTLLRTALVCLMANRVPCISAGLGLADRVRGVQTLLQLAAVSGRQLVIDGSLFTKTPLPTEPNMDRLYPKVRIAPTWIWIRFGNFIETSGRMAPVWLWIWFGRSIRIQWAHCTYLNLDLVSEASIAVGGPVCL
jgi:hypothetical protein